MRNDKPTFLKKYLFLLPMILLGSLTCAQSVKFNDLVYFTKLNNQQIYNSLREGKAFRQDYIMNVNGRELAYFKNIGAKPNSEKIEVGNFNKLPDGTLLRIVSYTSTQSENIIAMINQAKRYGLDLQFHGKDASNDIYLYDNDFYHVSIYFRRDQSSGYVEIKQKEYLGLD
jgi:hypothetical protein